MHFPKTVLRVRLGFITLYGCELWWETKIISVRPIRGLMPDQLWTPVLTLPEQALYHWAELGLLVNKKTRLKYRSYHLIACCSVVCAAQEGDAFVFWELPYVPIVQERVVNKIAGLRDCASRKCHFDFMIAYLRSVLYKQKLLWKREEILINVWLTCSFSAFLVWVKS